MKQKFNEWFATQLRNELESGKELENIAIKFLLSTMKPLHAGSLMDCYNQLTSSRGKEIILAGWRASKNICCCRRWLNSFSYRSI